MLRVKVNYVFEHSRTVLNLFIDNAMANTKIIIIELWVSSMLDYLCLIAMSGA